MLQILKNYRYNTRHIYKEPPIEIYNEDYYKNQCGGFETFCHSNGEELDAIRQYVLSLCPLQHDYSALDIGCGRGEIVFSLARTGLRYVVGIDLSDDSINISRKVCDRQIENGQIAIQRMSATQLELDDKIFDVIYMTDIVEHLSDANLKKAISEAHRVLKPGGSLVIHTLPTVNYKLYGQYITKYYFGLKGMKWWTPTSQEEAALCGHVNIQSKFSLESYLYKSFEAKNVKVFYDVVNSGSALKRLVSMLGLWKIMSPHLWAVAIK